MSSAAASSSVRYGHRPTHSVAAAKALIRASTGLADAGPDELLDRIRLFDEAIANDPALADAYAGKAEALLIAGTYRARVPAAAYADAAAHAAHALTLAPSLASAHAAYGAALLYAERDWRGAEHHLRQAIALDPANVAAEQWYSGYLSARGQHAEAIRAAERAVALAPASASALTGLGTALFYAGRFGDAIAACDEAARLLPAFVPARRCASAAAAEAGDYHAAMARVAAAAAGNAAPSLAATLTSPTTWSSPETFWHGRLGRMERAVTASSCQCDEPLLAVPLAHLGDTARAFDALERGADRMSDHLLYVGVHPAFAALRTSPRFGDLLRRLGLRGA